MNIPADLQYTADHEWIRFENDTTAVVGITDFAQGELGDIVFVEVETAGQDLGAGDVFGSIEAVKTVADLYLPITGKVLEVNSELEDNPEFVNEDPYGKGWIVKLEVPADADRSKLMPASDYQGVIEQ